jgi:type II secretory pathway pseudopilin PulG
VIILGGIVALTLLEVITNAQALEFGQKQVQTLEKAIITNLDTFATNNPSGWKSIQNDLYCCGYNNPYTYEQ